MTANEAQIEFWNGTFGDVWVEAQEQLDRMLAPLSDAALDQVGPLSGLRVIDIGCGCGGTTFALADRGANAWGVDISAPMLAHAESQAASRTPAASGTPAISGKGETRFSEADAAVHTFESNHQLIFSRFGVMFFDDPVGAFANLRTALTPEGKLLFMCWQGVQFNPWISVAARAIQPFLPESNAAPDPRAPGPFAFAERDYVMEILTSAGFADVVCEPLTGTLNVGRSLDDAIEFQTRIGPLSRILAEIEEDAVRAEAMLAARTALEGHLTPEGLLLDAACWLVSAEVGGE